MWGQQSMDRSETRQLFAEAVNPKNLAPLSERPFIIIPPTPGAEGSKPQFQHAPRNMHLNPQVNDAQQKFAAYFAIGCASIMGYVGFQSNARIRQFCNRKPTLFVGTFVLTGLIGTQMFLPNISRRSYQSMDRYDRDWKNMPLNY